jgi:hypothetical protein
MWMKAQQYCNRCAKLLHLCFAAMDREGLRNSTACALFCGFLGRSDALRADKNASPLSLNFMDGTVLGDT